MYECMYVWMYVCTYVCMYVRSMYVWMYVCTYVCMYVVCMYVYVYECMNVCTHVRMNVCMYVVCMYVCNISIQACKQTVAIAEICVSLGYCTVYTCNALQTFRNNLSVLSSKLKKSMKNNLFSTSLPLKMGPLGCPETSVRHYHCTRCNNPEEHRSRLRHGGRL
jgi:hypothetical protein